MEVSVFNPELGSRGNSISDLDASLGWDRMGTFVHYLAIFP